VVGADQRDHFLPWFKVVKKLLPDWSARMEHIGFGRYQGMSTRKGTAVFLAEVLDKARERAREAAEAATKKVDLSEAEKETVARAIGTGALKFFDLKAERTKDIDLSTEGQESIDWDRLLSLKGETGPYLQFAYARLAGILRKFEGEVSAEVRFDLLGEPEAKALIKALADFPSTVQHAAEAYEPSAIARYLIELSQKTHSFVHHHRVLDATPAEGQEGVSADELRASRVFLVACAKTVIGHALGLLGIETLERM
jgi:arginyl-tRNA synthetase